MRLVDTVSGTFDPSLNPLKQIVLLECGCDGEGTIRMTANLIKPPPGLIAKALVALITRIIGPVIINKSETTKLIKNEKNKNQCRKSGIGIS